MKSESETIEFKVRVTRSDDVVRPRYADFEIL